MHSRFSESWAARPRLSKGLSAALIALQGLLCILSFAFLLNILANEDPWFNYGESAFEKEGSSTIRNLIIAAVVLTSLALVLLAMPAKDSNRSWRLVRGVSVLTLSCLVVLIAALALLRREFPAGVSVEARSSLFYLETALGLMAASVGCFALAILFGKDPELSAKARKLQVAMVLISFYLFFGGLIYRRLEDWKYDDAVMFSLVTITSIGYGNIAPSFTGSRVFTIFFALSGLIFVGFAIEQFRSLVVEDITSKLTKGLEKTADKQGDMVRISKAKRDRYIKRFAVVFVLLAWWLIGAAIFMDLEGWTYFEAFYFSFVTLSTIGYGDFYPKNGNAKTFLIFFTIVGLGAFAFGLSTLSETDEEELSEKMKSKLSVQEGTSTGPAAQPAPPLPVHDTQKLASLAVQMSSLFHSLSTSKGEGERSDLLRKYLRMRQELDACFGPEAPAVSSV